MRLDGDPVTMNNSNTEGVTNSVQGAPMNRSIRRLLIIIAGSVGFATITAADALAGTTLQNHIEPV
jgi:hypothetical protein